ncbi:hypothetical protein [Maribacter sp. Hel_I_7]|uniref:hypothetical protein n=1 Tax=Maribacter sp. Hel_I_7 TaxID=1249997 RepID=UPI0012DC66ED|nr:hypothetical protein [Maribacter sp. Hel_I_7]
MGRHKMIKGICHLCGQNTDLSFEHVPPRTTFNKNTKYTSVDFEDYIKIKNPLKEKPKGKIKQGGIGYNSFCKECNSFLGANYVPAYKRWVQGGFEILKNTEFCPHKYLIKEVEPLKILKHIISMFLAINGDWYLETYPELSDFVANPESQKLSDKFRVFTYLTKAEKLRYISHVAKVDTALGTHIKCSEIAFPPYGAVLTIDFSGQINFLNDITRFRDFNLSKKTNLTVNMFQLPTNTGLSPLDYRKKSQLELDIEKNIALSDELERKFNSKNGSKETSS